MRDSSNPDTYSDRIHLILHGSQPGFDGIIVTFWWIFIKILCGIRNIPSFSCKTPDSDRKSIKTGGFLLQIHQNPSETTTLALARRLRPILQACAAPGAAGRVTFGPVPMEINILQWNPGGI